MLGAFDSAISKVWASAWVEYLFYDSKLFAENTLTKNFCLPHPPIKYNFNVRIGDQILKINRCMNHIIFTIYGEGYTGQPILEANDEELLKRAVKGDISEKLSEKINHIVDKLIFKKLSDRTKPDFQDEWFEFADDDNVYEHTLPDEGMFQSDELRNKKEPSDSVKHIQKDMARHDDIPFETEHHKVTLGDGMYTTPRGYPKSGSMAEELAAGKRINSIANETLKAQNFVQNPQQAINSLTNKLRTLNTLEEREDSDGVQIEDPAEVDDANIRLDIKDLKED